MEKIYNNIANNILKNAEEFLSSHSNETEINESLSGAIEIIQNLLSLQSETETQNIELQNSQERFQKEREFYQDILNNHPAGLYRICVLSLEKWGNKSWANSDNPPYTVEFMSDRFSEILEISRKEFEQNFFIISDLIFADDKGSFVKENKIANKKIIPFRWEGRIVVNKKIKWIRLESIPQKLNNNDVQWTGILYDLTERINNEEELNKTRVQLEDVLSGANIGTLEWNIQTGKIKFNDIWAKNLGYSVTELKIGSVLFGSKGWKKLTHPDDIAYADEMLLRHFSGEMPNYIIEVRMRHKKGHWVWMRQMGKVKTWTQDGKPLLMYGIHTNIDDRKRSEIELSNINNELEKRVQKRTLELETLNTELLLSEQKFRTISDFTYDWEYWKSPENKIIFMSPSVVRITGYSISEFENNPGLLDEIVYISDQDIWKNHITKRTEDTKEGDSVELTFRIVTKKGEIRSIGHVCRSIYVNGMCLGIRVSNRDITDKMNAEKELLAVTINVEEKERNRFSSELHDGMGPLLSTIKLYFQWLSENEDKQKNILITEKGNQCIEAAIQTARELSRGLSSQLLAKSGYVVAIKDFCNRINDTGKIKVVFKTNTNKIFHQFLEITLYRITTELLKNTITYANASLIEIDFEFNKDYNKVILTYSDNGIGFDYETIKSRNTGLGLMNIQHRVQILKGTIKIESSTNDGMKANIHFPIDELID
ncbi:MAG: PAS domain-containing protein [Paludibacter sp.]|nr:PAS domain-containing protein [Paludibacter sp.]